MVMKGKHVPVDHSVTRHLTLQNVVKRRLSLSLARFPFMVVAQTARLLHKDQIAWGVLPFVHVIALDHLHLLVTLLPNSASVSQVLVEFNATGVKPDFGDFTRFRKGNLDAFLALAMSMGALETTVNK